MTFNISEHNEKMDKSVEILKKEFAGLRTGRASPGLLEPLMVDAYGSKVPITQVGNIGVPEPRMLTIQIWDASLVSSVESSITSSNLGLNPMTEGTLIRLPIPDLTEERRKEIAKLASKYAEDSKIAIRNIRREANEDLKKKLKEKDISEDDNKNFEKNIQKLTDINIEKIEKILVEKEKEIIRI